MKAEAKEEQPTLEDEINLDEKVKECIDKAFTNSLKPTSRFFDNQSKEYTREEQKEGYVLTIDEMTQLLEQYASTKTPTEEEIDDECERRFSRIPNIHEQMEAEQRFYAGAKWVIKQLKK